ncbi:MAG TPA: hypothetical protein VNH11_34750 [Pirellulales bacterium]|nr:hypothetical protein [Pirellulales bacterium]
MRRFHFSLRGLFGVVSFAAVSCGLMVYATAWFSLLTFTAVLFMLITAATAAIFCSGARRAYWGGFAAFGFAYLWATCGQWQSPDGSAPLRDRLVTSELLDRCHQMLPTTVMYATPAAAPWPSGSTTYTYSAAPPGTMPGTPGPMGAEAFIMPTVDQALFITTGHALFALVFAVLGGVIAKRCYLSSS